MTQRLPAINVIVIVAVAAGLLSAGEDEEARPAANSHPPFSATADLFDSGNETTLGLQTVTGQHRLLYRASETGDKFCHHPNLALFKNELYCMWSNGRVDEDAPGQRILYSRSPDGADWTEPVMLTDDRDGEGICVAAGFLNTPHQLIAYYTATGGTNFHPETALWARTSRDGTTWSDPTRIVSGFFIEGPRQLEGNRLLLAGEAVGEARVSQRAQFLSTDAPSGLQNWETAPIGTYDLNQFGYTEPSFFRQPDGTVVATLRNNSGFLYATESTDNGRTWSSPLQTNFPDSTARTSAGNLPDGTAFLINNPLPEQFDRSLLTIALSRDGHTFDRAFLLRGEPTKRRYNGKHKLDGWQYPHALVWHESLYVAYSINKEDVGLTRIALSDLNP